MTDGQRRRCSTRESPSPRVPSILAVRRPAGTLVKEEVQLERIRPAEKPSGGCTRPIVNGEGPLATYTVREPHNEDLAAT